MRDVKIRVGSKPLREQKTWAYPSGQNMGLFLTPVYDCFVEGIDNSGGLVRERFDVLRFGVHSKDGKTATVVGLAEHQTHVIKAWIPSYRVHSATSTENGAWQVYANFLIHDGPDNATEVFATIGCIEIMGHQGFVKFNDLIIRLTNPLATNRDGQLGEIGRSGRVSITYEKASRPPLRKAP